MALVVLTGQPCSGKTELAKRLQALVAAHGRECSILGDDALSLDRNTAYADGWREKETRARIKSEVERGIGRRRVLVLDSLNTIKGYRYELYCIARAAAVRYCMVHVDSEVGTCRTWNAARATAGAPSWSTTVFDDLAARYERPDSRQRWDAPLFTLRPDRDDQAEVDAQLQAVLTHVLDLAQIPTPAGVGDGEPRAAPPSRALAPTMATTNAKLSSTNLLHDIDRATNEVLETVSRAQAAMPGAAPGLMTVAELRRHKRSFLRLATNLVLTRAPDAASARRMFVDYLADQMAEAV